MADPRDIVPYNDLYDDLDAVDILDFMADQNPSLADLTNIAGPANSARPNPEAGSGIRESNMRFEIPRRWVWPNSQYVVGESSRAGSSDVGGSGGGENTNNPLPNNVQRQTPVDYNTSQVLVVPISPAPFYCSCCQVLRQIVHSNGIKIKKFEIHGRLGMITHAVIEDRPILSANSYNTHYQMVDLCKKSLGEIKRYIIRYNVSNILEQYRALPEALFIFYDTLCAGMEWDSQNNANGQPPPAPPSNPPPPAPPSNPPPPPPPPSQQPPSSPPPGNPPTEGPPDQGAAPGGNENGASTSLAAQLAQRQRTVRMTMNEIRQYFHLPISEASRRLGLCPTVVKKICRRNGLTRWPHRKLKSFRRKLSILRPSLYSSNAETKARAEAEMERIREEMIQILAGVDLS